MFTTIHTLLFDPATNTPSISNIRLLANRHSQSFFAHAASRHRLNLRLTSRAAPHAIARVRACAIRGAASLLLCHRIPAGVLLTNAEFVFYICHRLGIPPPSISPAATRRCTPRCRTITASKPLNAAHPHFPFHPHCYHQLTCGCSPLRLKRHNHLARCAAQHLSAEASLEASLVANLHSSLTSQTKVDLLLTSALVEQPTAIDFTVSCPLLPSYLAAAVHDALAIITARAEEKTAKHAAGSAARNRIFLPWVLTTFGGMGPASVWHYIDTIYSTSTALANQSRTARHAVAQRKAEFLATLQAILIRSCHTMLLQHTAERAAPAATADTPQPATTANAPSPVPSRSTTPEPDGDGDGS